MLLWQKQRNTLRSIYKKKAGKVFLRFFMIHRKYRVLLKRESNDSYESKMLRKDAHLAEMKLIAMRYRSGAENQRC